MVPAGRIHREYFVALTTGSQVNVGKRWVVPLELVGSGVDAVGAGSAMTVKVRWLPGRRAGPRRSSSSRVWTCQRYVVSTSSLALGVYSVVAVVTEVETPLVVLVTVTLYFDAPANGCHVNLGM